MALQFKYTEITFRSQLIGYSVDNFKTYSIKDADVDNREQHESLYDFWLMDIVCCRTGNVYNFTINETLKVAYPSNEISLNAYADNIVILNEHS